MTSDEKNIINISKYKSGQLVTANNLKRPINRISKTMFLSHQRSAIVELQNIYHVLGIKKITFVPVFLVQFRVYFQT